MTKDMRKFIVQLNIYLRNDNNNLKQLITEINWNNDLKEIISATSSHLCFSNSNYYEQTSERTKKKFLSEKIVTQILLART